MHENVRRCVCIGACGFMCVSVCVGLGGENSCRASKFGAVVFAGGLADTRSRAFAVRAKILADRRHTRETHTYQTNESAVCTRLTQCDCWRVKRGGWFCA